LTRLGTNAYSPAPLPPPPTAPDGDGDRFVPRGSPSMAFARSTGLIVAVTAALVLLPNLGGSPLWDDDEPRNAACSLAMLGSGDWIVPTFNGRLRVEKPVLVNWLHFAGYALAGRNETGARLGSACLTIGTALVTWRLATTLLGVQAGLVAGLAMATSIATAASGRSATPDAPLAFFTTLALWCAVAARSDRHAGRPGDRRWSAACGAALGAAVLAKGPVGIVLPLAALAAHATWEACGDGVAWPSTRRWRAELAAIRPGLIVACALAVALPWYAAVTLRTDGVWLDRFLMVHNVGRFAAPMEGHDGPALLYYPTVLAIGFFPWSIVLLAVVCRALSLAGRPAAPAHRATVVAGAWLTTWLLAFSLSATKLPGYVWPAYPALAVLTAAFLVDWVRDELPLLGRRAAGSAAPDRVLGVAWSILVVVGLTGAAAAAVGVERVPSPSPMLILPCLLAAAGGCLAWWWQAHDRRGRSVATLAVTATLFTGLLAGYGPAAVRAGSSGPRELAASLAPCPADGAWVSLGPVPASLVFYTGTAIRRLDSAAAAVEHLRTRPDGLVFVAQAHGSGLTAILPSACDIVHRVPLPFTDDLLVIGRRTAAETLVACQASPTTP